VADQLYVALDKQTYKEIIEKLEKFRELKEEVTGKKKKNKVETE
jgi:hypothetical protein